MYVYLTIYTGKIFANPWYRNALIQSVDLPNLIKSGMNFPMQNPSMDLPEAEIFTVWEYTIIIENQKYNLRPYC